MKICWDNIKDIYIPKRPHAKCDFKNIKGKKLYYKESCKECNEPFLSFTKIGEFCDRTCKNIWINKHKDYTFMRINNPMFDEELKKKNIENRCLFEHRVYWHKKAWELFGKDHCEKCGLALNEYYDIYNKNFDMHNNLNPKNYTILESEAWQCLCRSCHTKIEKETI